MLNLCTSFFIATFLTCSSKLIEPLSTTNALELGVHIVSHNANKMASNMLNVPRTQLDG